MTRSTGNLHGSKWIRPERRRRIYARDGFACVWCGATSPLTLDHIRPRNAGGDNSTPNLVTACGPCNSRRGEMGVTAFAHFVGAVTGEAGREIAKRVHRLRRRALPPGALDSAPEGHYPPPALSHA